MKKSLSLVLAIAIFASMFLGIPMNTSAATVANVNLFSDGDFENLSVSGTDIPSGQNSDNFDNWYRTGYAGATVVGSTGDANNGTKSLKLSVQSNYPNTYGYYKNIKVEPNTNYSISFMYKATEMNGDFRAVITSAFNEEDKTCRYIFTNQTATHTYNKDNGNTTSIVTNKVTDGWVKASVAFNSGANEVLRLYFRLRGQANSGPGTAGNCTVFVDDIVLNSHGLAFNGGFENFSKADTTAKNDVVETNIWQRQSSASTCGNTVIGSNDIAHTGARSFKFAATASRSAYYSNFNVEANTMYRVTFWYKITKAGEFRGAIGTTSMASLDNAAGRIAYLGSSTNSINSSVTSDWVKVQKTFDSGDNSLLRIMFWMAQNGVAYLDDLCIEKIGSTPAEVVEGNVFDDGSFEEDGEYNPERKDDITNVETWYRPQNDYAYLGDSKVGSLEDQHTGNRSFKLSTQSSSNQYIFYKNFAVEKNTIYTVTYWYNMTVANGEFRSSVTYTDKKSVNSNSDLCPMGGDKNTLVSGSVTNGWVKVTRKFNSGDNSTLRLILQLYNLKGSTTVYIDDISVVKVPQAVEVEGNLLTNGTFEDSTITDFGGGNGTNTDGAYSKWYRNGYIGNSTQYSTEKAKTGLGSMKLSTLTGANASGAYIYYRDIDVKANTSYTFKFSYLVTECAGNTLCGLIVPTTYYNTTSDNLVYFGSQNSYMNISVSDSWVDKTFTLKTANNTTVRILFRLIGDVNKSTTVYFDDMSLVENVQKVAETPDAPTIESSTKSSVTLTANEAYEYSINGGEWVSTSTFTGLVSGVKYTFTQRAKAYDDYIASPASETIEYLIAVAGDTNGDGVRNSVDLTNIRKELLNVTNDILNSYGMDSNDDGIFDIRDLVSLKKKLANLKNVGFTIGDFAINDFTVYSSVSTKIGTQAIDEFISFVNDTFGCSLTKSNQKTEKYIEFVVDETQDTDYYSVTSNDSKLIFTAGSDYKLLDAVRMFTSRLNNVEDDKVYGVQEGFVLNDQSYNFESGNYSLVFNDEFNGTTLNSNVWFNAVTPAVDRVYDSENDRKYIDNSAVSVADGVLKLTSSKVKNEQNGYDYVGASLRSRGNVEFGYGYVEIKAKLPEGENHNTSYWLAGNRTDAKPYATEIDVFETLGYENKIVPDIHIWYTTDSENLPSWIIENESNAQHYDSQNKSEFDMSSGNAKEVDNIDSKYHIYGCEWTPTTLTLYLDGEAYATYDLQSDTRFTAFSQGDLVSLCLGVQQYGDISVWDNTKFPGEYIVDYVRLYQKQDGRLSGKAIADKRDMSWTLTPENYKLVAFTFDDAPVASSVGDNTMTKLVNLFNKYNGAATYSVIGNKVNSYGTSVLQYAVDNNFELINHTMTHQTITDSTTYDSIEKDIMDCHNLIKEKLNYEMKFVRTGGLSQSSTLYEVATALNMPVLGSGGVSTLDYDPNTTDDHIKDSLLNTYDGRIVLLHCENCVTGRYDDRGETWIEMLDEILSDLYSQGFRFVTVSELFKYKGIENIPTTYTLVDSNVK